MSLLSVQPCSCSIKLKRWRRHSHFNIALISLINILFTEQHSSLRKILEICILTLSERFWKQTSISIKHCAMSYGESIQISLVPHEIITFVKLNSLIKLLVVIINMVSVFYIGRPFLVFELHTGHAIQVMTPFIVSFYQELSLDQVLSCPLRKVKRTQFSKNDKRIKFTWLPYYIHGARLKW